MREDYTHIVILLDRSGSMTCSKPSTIEAVNAFITEQRKQPGKATLQLIQFDDQYEAWAPTSLRKAALLNDENYQPRGGTPLYYALWRAINDTGAWLRKKAEEKRPAKVVFVVMTDGEHNANLNKYGAPQYPYINQEEVAAAVGHQQEKYAWNFIYLGANQNAFLVADTIGIRRTATLTYAQNTRGLAAASSSIARSVTQYRSGETLESCFAMGDYEAQIKAGVDESLATPDTTTTTGKGPQTSSSLDLTGHITSPHIPFQALPNLQGDEQDEQKTPQGIPVKKVTRSASNNTSSS